MQRKGLLVLAVVVLITGGIAAISGAGSHMPAADAGKLWTHITTTNPYDGWGFWPGHVGMYPGKSPHGAYLKVYANTAALKAAREGKPMPDGAIIVKENYGKDKQTLMAVTPMYKIDGYNPEGGDWYWAKYGADGSVDKAGKVKGCIQCHSVKKNNDWIFTPTE
jgi:hypothetical protein